MRIAVLAIWGSWAQSLSAAVVVRWLAFPRLSNLRCSVSTGSHLNQVAEHVKDAMFERDVPVMLTAHPPNVPSGGVETLRIGRTAHAAAWWPQKRIRAHSANNFAKPPDSQHATDSALRDLSSAGRCGSGGPDEFLAGEPSTRGWFLGEGSVGRSRHHSGRSYTPCSRPFSSMVTACTGLGGIAR